MAIQPILIPPEWNWAFDLVVGQDWPQADEDALRRLAQYWTDALNGLLGIAHDGNTAAQNVNYSVQAVSSDEFTKYWDAYTDGDDSIIGQMARQAEVLAAELLQFAEQTEFTKLSINIQIVILLIQLIFDAATALISAGATTAEGIVAALITRLTVKNLLTELIKAVVMAVLPDVITQVVMITEGHRSSFDVGETLQAAQMGVIGGLVGAGAGALLGGVGTGIGKWAGTTLGRTIGEDLGTQIGKEAGKVAGAALTGAATNVFTNAATGLVDTVENKIHAAIDPEYAKELAAQSQNQGHADQKAAQNPFTAALNGAFTGVLFHGVHEAGTHFTDSVYQPTEFTTTTDNGQTVTYKALPKADGTYAVHTEDYNYVGTGTLDGSTLTVTPSKGNVFQATQAPEHGTTTDTAPTVTTTDTTTSVTTADTNTSVTTTDTTTPAITTDNTHATVQLADVNHPTATVDQQIVSPTTNIDTPVTPAATPAVTTVDSSTPLTPQVIDQPVIPQASTETSTVPPVNTTEPASSVDVNTVEAKTPVVSEPVKPTAVEISSANAPTTPALGVDQPQTNSPELSSVPADSHETSSTNAPAATEIPAQEPIVDDTISTSTHVSDTPTAVVVPEQHEAWVAMGSSDETNPEPVGFSSASSPIEPATALELSRLTPEQVQARKVRIDEEIRKIDDSDLFDHTDPELKRLLGQSLEGGRSELSADEIRRRLTDRIKQAVEDRARRRQPLEEQLREIAESKRIRSDVAKGTAEADEARNKADNAKADELKKKAEAQKKRAEAQQAEAEARAVQDPVQRAEALAKAQVADRIATAAERKAAGREQVATELEEKAQQLANKAAGRGVYKDLNDFVTKLQARAKGVDIDRAYAELERLTRENGGQLGSEILKATWDARSPKRLPPPTPVEPAGIDDLLNLEPKQLAARRNQLADEIAKLDTRLIFNPADPKLQEFLNQSLEQLPGETPEENLARREQFRAELSDRIKKAVQDRAQERKQLATKLHDAAAVEAFKEHPAKDSRGRELDGQARQDYIAQDAANRLRGDGNLRVEQGRDVDRVRSELERYAAAYATERAQKESEHALGSEIENAARDARNGLPPEPGLKPPPKNDDLYGPLIDSTSGGLSELGQRVNAGSEAVRRLLMSNALGDGVHGAYMAMVHGFDSFIGAAKLSPDEAANIRIADSAEGWKIYVTDSKSEDPTGSAGKHILSATGGELQDLQHAGGVPSDRIVGSGPNRHTDAEATAVRQVQATLDAMARADQEPVGFIVIGSDKLMCPSCQEIVNEIQANHPFVRVILATEPESVVTTAEAAERNPAWVWGTDMVSGLKEVPLPTDIPSWATLGGNTPHEEVPAFDFAKRTDQTVPPEWASAAHDPTSDPSAFGEIAKALRTRAANTGRVQALVENRDGSLQWIESGRDGLGLIPEELGVAKVLVRTDAMPDEKREPISMDVSATDQLTRRDHWDRPVLIPLDGDKAYRVEWSLRRDVEPSGWLLRGLNSTKDTAAAANYAAVHGEEGVRNVIAHATKEGVVVEGRAANGGPLVLSAEELAKVIPGADDHPLATPLPRRESEPAQPVRPTAVNQEQILRVLGCDVGGGEAISRLAAQNELAAKGYTEVVAADSKVWVSDKGVVIAAPHKPGSGTAEGTWRMWRVDPSVLADQPGTVLLSGDGRIPSRSIPAGNGDKPEWTPLAEEASHATPNQRPFQTGGGYDDRFISRDGPWYKLFGPRRFAEPEPQTLVHGHDADGDYVENPATGERFPNVRAAAEKMLQDFADKARAEFGDLISEPDKALRSLAEIRAVKDDNRLEQPWKPAQDLATELAQDLHPEIAAALKHIADRPAQVRTALADFIATAPEELRAPVRDLLNATLRDRVAVHDLLRWQDEPGLSQRIGTQHGFKVLERLVDPSNPAVTALLSDSRTAEPAVRAVLTDMLGADADARRGFVALLDPAARGHLDSFQEAAPAVAAIAILPGQGQDAVFFSTSAKGGEPEHEPFVQKFLDQRRAQLEALRTEIENQLLDDRRGQVIEAAPRQDRGEPTPAEKRYPWPSSEVDGLQRVLRDARRGVADDADVARALRNSVARQADEAVAAKLPAEHIAALRRERQEYEEALKDAEKKVVALDELLSRLDKRRQTRLDAILKAHPEDGAPLAEVDRLLKQLGHCGEMGACDDAARALRAALPAGLSPEEQNTRLAAAFHDVVFGAVEIGTHRLTEPGPRALTETGFVHGTWKEACPNCAAALEYFHGAELNRDGVRIFDEHPPGQSGGGYEGAQEPWTRGEPAASPIRSVQEAQLGAMLMRQFRNGAATMVDRLRTAMAVMAGVDPSELEGSFHHDRLNSGTVPAEVSVDELIADGNTRELLASFIGAAFGSEDPLRFDKLVLETARAGDLERLGAAGLDVKAVHDYIDFLKQRLGHFPKTGDFTDPGNLADFFSPGSDTASDLRAGSRRTLRPDADDQKYLLPLSELEMNGIGLSSREITDLLARARDNRVIAENYQAGRVPWSTGEARYTPGSLDQNKPSAWFQRNTVEGDMPAVAGPSGTTTRVFAIAKFLRPSADLAGDFAAALTGYLVSSHHHSMSEVVQGLDALHFYDTPESRDNIASALNLDTLYGKVPGLVRHEPTAWVPDPAHPGSLTEQVQPFLHHIEARPPDLLDPAAQLHWARDVYAEIGHNPDAVVKAVVKVLEHVPRADGGVGYSQDEVAAVHSYLFVEEHDLADGLGGTIRAQFDADPEIAAAWQRMASGVVDARDLVLMEHELAEMKYFAEHPGATLLEAHRAANAVANWERTQPYARRQALYDYAKKMRGDVGVVSEDGGRQLSKPFQSGGHYQGADSDKPKEPGGNTGQKPPRLPGVRKVILEALNGSPQHTTQEHFLDFSSNELGEEYGEKTLGAMVRNLPPDVQKAVKQYTSVQWVNEFLRAPNAQQKLTDMPADLKHDLGRYYKRQPTVDEILAMDPTEEELTKEYSPTLADVQTQVSLIDQAIAASPLPEGLVVHRGLTDITFMTKTSDPSALVGKVFTEQGYTSGALGATPPDYFASRKFQLHLRVPKGSHALWLGKWSEGGTQRELLLPRGTQYEITEVRPIAGTDRWDIYARVVRPGDPSVPWTP